ncbi:MAG: hypothetical protein AAFO82_13200, partial [Bacteroidota bacterium]
GRMGICNPQIINCQFINNTASSHGGGIFNNAESGGKADPSVKGSLFEKNIGYVNGKNIYPITSKSSFSIEYLPLTVYFDDHTPFDIDTSKLNFTSNYIDDLWGRYYNKKEIYKSLFSEPMEEEEAFLTNQRYEQFFEREVKQGGENLRKFAFELSEFLKQGKEITIILKGFTSPRGNEENNYNLSIREIVSVENFFREFNNGSLNTYIINGKFTMVREPQGEKEAPNYVISFIDDERNSIYSLGASLERRVEIVSDIK